MASVESRLSALEALVLGLKKEVGLLRRQVKEQNAEEHDPSECRKGLGDACQPTGPYQYQQGCRAEPCRLARSAYYNKKPAEQPLPTPKKRMIKRGGQ